MKKAFTKLQIILLFFIANLYFTSAVCSQSATIPGKSLLQKTPTLLSDSDGDGVTDAQDNCPFTTNPTQADFDMDMIGDACDKCMNVSNPNQLDSDSDMIGDVCDNCPTTANPDQSDSDGDMIGNACDNCPNVVNPDQTDADGDMIGNACDNCPNMANSDQMDSDGDMIGNACDNCPTVANPDQTDTDLDQIGDACETLGIKNQAIDNPCSINLDPHSNTLIIKGKDILKTEVFTSSGEIIVQKNTNSNQVSIELANHASGIYVVKITTETGITVKKVLLNKN